MVLERALTPTERDAIARNFIDQEILLRQAIKLELHLSDGKVRHRLADKMMFLLAEEPTPPDSAELARYYQQNKTRYTTQRRVSFEHRFYGNDEAAARVALADEGTKAEAQFFWLGNQLEQMSAQDLVSTFGAAFAQAIEQLPQGQWHGPLASNRGWHLVRVQSWHEPRPIPREHLDERLRTEWLADRREQAREAALEALRASYDIQYLGGE